MPFEYKGKAEIKHLNPRKGTGDDSQAAIDIKLAIEGLPLTTAAAALGVEDPEQLKRSLFRSVAEDADETARFFGIKSIASAASWEDKHAIAISGFRRLRVHRVGKIDLVPRAAGKFDGHLSVTIVEPPAGFVDLLMQQLNGTVEVNLEHDAELDLHVGTAGDGTTVVSVGAKQGSMNLSRHDKKLARGDVNRALRGNSQRKKAAA